MTKINIVVSFDLPSTYIKKIQSLSDHIIVKKSSNEKRLLELMINADLVFAGKFSKEMFFTSKRLKWIQYTGTGIDKIFFPELIKSDVIITNSGDIFSTAISEHILMFMLMLNRKMNFFFQNREKRQWNRLGGYLAENLQVLDGKTVGIIGFGDIGQEFARKAKSLGMHVIATKKTIPKDKPVFIEKFIPNENLNLLLAASDFIVLALPLTPQTDGLIGEKEFKAMKKTSFIINVSRGRLIQEDKLIDALEKGRIAGAALDTFVEEPLSKDSKLWSNENVIITPHVAGISNFYIENVVRVFCHNLQLYLAQESLENVVSKENSY